MEARRHALTARHLEICPGFSSLKADSIMSNQYAQGTLIWAGGLKNEMLRGFYLASLAR